MAHMKSSNGIVAGGGWTKELAVGRPKAQWFGLFSLLWLGVSICALSPFSEGWPYVFGYLEWLCLGLLVPQPILIALTIFFFLTEKPRSSVHWYRNRNHDLRKLY
jgi:hypothetical protein